MKKHYQLASLLTLTLCLNACALSSNDQSIDLDSVTADMQFLASDDLKGRLAGSSEITVAEDYIAKQFQQAGLQPLKGLNSYKQNFTLNRYLPKTLKVKLNQQNIHAEKIAVAGSISSIRWNKESAQHLVIGKNDDLRSSLNSLNQHGENTIVLIDSTHQEMFARYRNKFTNGSQSLERRAPAAIVLILTDETVINTIEVSASIDHQQQTLSNVIGVLPGKSKADEFVVFSAHHDHLGTQAPDINGNDQDLIYNGANDDASGVTAVLNLARYYANPTNISNNERSIMFVTFTAEESGLLGSSHFVNDIDADSITAMLNIEMIGKAAEFGAGTYWMTGYERSNLATILQQNLSANSNNAKQQIFADPYKKYGLFYRSDNASLAKLGVPAHSLSSTQMTNDHDYHQVSDEIGTLDLEQMTAIINSIASASSSLIDGSDTPDRIEKIVPRAQGLIF
ncbi:M28 family peptidase [Thalassotalea sp. ND16A]|uniref:M28 family peptidase n=1 Tax=Thalassotalea sp. ND16A TaxID=1535422 RepID=UPI00051CDE4F|nr:M28 family peptidase [Thalassotalea sp. ND16A]KGJ88790.1 hypothetical protein ND16A_2492 [Thalassotalea sp. ND16A]